MVDRVPARIFRPETVELWQAGTTAKHRARIAKARAKELDELVEEQLAKVAAFESAHRE